jgi:hypothetical protein
MIAKAHRSQSAVMPKNQEQVYICFSVESGITLHLATAKKMSPGSLPGLITDDAGTRVESRASQGAPSVLSLDRQDQPDIRAESASFYQQ